MIPPRWFSFNGVTNIYFMSAHTCFNRVNFQHRQSDVINADPDAEYQAAVKTATDAAR